MKTFKKILTATLSMTMAFGLVSGAYAANDLKDVADGKWYTNAVNYCQAKGYVGGYTDGTFRPDRPVTRAELVVMLSSHATANGIKKPDTGKTYESFKDRNSGGLHEWNHEPVHWAVSRGIIAGYDDGTIRLTDPVSREQAAVILSNYFDVAKKSGNTTYSDNDQISSWALSSVKGMTDEKHLAGTGNNMFTPKATLSRAQVCQIIMSFANIIENEAIPTHAEENSTLECVAMGVWEYTTKTPVVKNTTMKTQEIDVLPIKEEDKLIQKIDSDAEKNPVYYEKLADPVVGMLAAYDNWGELEEIYIPNGDGTYYIPERTWVEIVD